MIHDPAFCERVLEEFGCDRSGLIVNGHVPVKIDKGESPVKTGGKAITIDGAFSPACGDHGSTNGARAGLMPIPRPVHRP